MAIYRIKRFSKITPGEGEKREKKKRNGHILAAGIETGAGGYFLKEALKKKSKSAALASAVSFIAAGSHIPEAAKHHEEAKFAKKLQK